MDIHRFNQTNTFHRFLTPTFIWCFLMPLIHLLSLISNLLCIIVFCSKTFIQKPIAVYFICLLISDSTTLLIGYSEMLDRESSMIEQSSFLCGLNGRVIRYLADFIYTFMGKFCLEWMLYKVLWTRASTILLAILSIQRSRTFLSLSYHESRFCALVACILSVFVALLITCFEWIGVQGEKPLNPLIYWEIVQSIAKNQTSREFYSKFLHGDHPCLNQTFNFSHQFNCTTTNITSEFYSLTNSLLSNRDIHVYENLSAILYNTHDNTTGVLIEHINQAKSPEIIVKFFEKRSCHITLPYSMFLKFYDFLHSISFAFNRHTLAIFFGNALPSFLVVLANVLSLKVIYFSRSLQYLKQRRAKNGRLQSDLRAFLVILIESFSVITISWGIPILLTMYHCRTLYVLSMDSCPSIQRYLAIFLFTDLFNSSTNCLLYSLSGKLFRRKFLAIIKVMFTCGRRVLWNVRPRAGMLPTQQMELQASDEPPMMVRSEIHSRYEVTFKPSSKRRHLDDDISLSIVKSSDEQDIDDELVVKKSRTIQRFLCEEISWFGLAKRRKEKKRTNASYSSSSSAGMGSQPQKQRYSLKIISNRHRTPANEQSLEKITNL